MTGTSTCVCVIVTAEREKGEKEKKGGRKRKKGIVGQVLPEREKNIDKRGGPHLPHPAPQELSSCACLDAHSGSFSSSLLPGPFRFQEKDYRLEKKTHIIFIDYL